MSSPSAPSPGANGETRAWPSTDVLGKSLTMAYADPVYLGCSKLYPEHPESYVWDDPETHRQLIERLCDEYADGWALSLSTTSLHTILPMCPSNVRIGSWVKSFCAFKKGVRPCYAWEPIIFRGGRNPGFGFSHAPPEKGGKQNTPKDFLLACPGCAECCPAIKEPITLKKGLTGAKPEKVCHWILDLLNVQEHDTFDDLFPGTDVMGRCLTERFEVAA